MGNLNSQKNSFEPILRMISSVSDPRVQGRCRYRLRDILGISFCAIFCGEKTFTDIEDWALANEDWLRSYLKIEGEIPSHDTFRRILGLIDSQQLEELFSIWARELQSERAQHVCIDGKTLTGTQPDFSKNPLTLVSVFDCGSGLVLGQDQARAPGFGEISAGREVLKRIDLRGVLLSADAAYAWPSFAHEIRQQKGHYLLAIKKNNRRQSLAWIEALFSSSRDELKKKKYDFDRVEIEEHGHGRYEKRVAEVVSPSAELKSKWPDIKTVIRVARTRVEQSPRFYGEIEEKSYFYICSRKLDAAQALSLVRARWKIENQLHWRLDVILLEDDCQVRERVAARNLALIRKIAFNLYAKDPRPISCRRKMRASGRSSESLEKTLEMASR